MENKSSTYEVIRMTVMLGTILTLALVCFYLVSIAFDRSLAAGIRSFAGVLLPLVAGGFVFVFKRSLLGKLADLPLPLSFLFGLGFGVLLMVMIANLEVLQFAPIAELVVASGLSLFLFSPGSLHGLTTIRQSDQPDRWLSYYFGFVSGLLGYVVSMGVPFGATA